MSKITNAGALLAAARWAKPNADRDQPRRAGALGGRKPTCACGACPKCRRRAAAHAKAAA